MNTPIDERAEFERIYRSIYPTICACSPHKFDQENGDYCENQVQTAWAVYQACQAPLLERLRVAEADSHDSYQKNGLAWAVQKWTDEVSRRPLINVHRRSLDDTWRQVVRYFGGNPVKLLGPSHDDLLIIAKEQTL